MMIIILSVAKDRFINAITVYNCLKYIHNNKYKYKSNFNALFGAFITFVRPKAWLIGYKFILAEKKQSKDRKRIMNAKK